MVPIWAIAVGGAAAWTWWRKRNGLPVLPHLGAVPHVAVITSNGPALVPATVDVVPISVDHPSVAPLMQAASVSMARGYQQVIAEGVHAPRYLAPNPNTLGGMGGGVQQGVLGAFDPFDPYTTAPSSLHVDAYGVLRSSFTRPFYAR